MIATRPIVFKIILRRYFLNFRIFTYFTILFTVLHLSGCASVDLYSPVKGTEIVLSNKDDNSKSVETFKLWSILYGTVPITNPSSEAIFKTGKKFRIKESATAFDIVVSIIAGFSTSITVKTLVVESLDGVTVGIDQVKEPAKVVTPVVEKENVTDPIPSELKTKEMIQVETPSENKDK